MCGSAASTVVTPRRVTSCASTRKTRIASMSGCTLSLPPVAAGWMRQLPPGTQRTGIRGGWTSSRALEYAPGTRALQNGREPPDLRWSGVGDVPGVGVVAAALGQGSTVVGQSMLGKPGGHARCRREDDGAHLLRPLEERPAPPAAPT